MYVYYKSTIFDEVSCISSESNMASLLVNPEVASTVVALGSRGWLREAAQVDDENVGKIPWEGDGILGIFVVDLAHVGWAFLSLNRAQESFPQATTQTMLQCVGFGYATKT